MKLIEKMAEESLKTHPEYDRGMEGEDIDGFATCYELGFEAGFRKAREMAAKYVDELELNEFGIIHGDYARPILNLGESEIDEFLEASKDPFRGKYYPVPIEFSESEAE